MDVVGEIREYFASLPCPGIREIENLPEEYKAYVIRNADGYGVAIQGKDGITVSERFNNIKLC